MIDKEKMIGVVEGLLEGTDKYLIDLQVKTGNIITVIIDSDSTLTIDDCSALSKGIESRFDRDVEDFELRVTSYGADKPLKLKRQFVKNTGRKLEVLFQDDKRQKGKLVDVTENGIVLEPEQKKKARQKPVDPLEIAFDEIKEAKIILAFK